MARSSTITLYAALAIAVAVGIAVGVGGLHLRLREGYSYLRTIRRHRELPRDGAAVPAPSMKSSHHAVADCNDCHTPHGP